MNDAHKKFHRVIAKRMGEKGFYLVPKRFLYNSSIPDLFTLQLSKDQLSHFWRAAQFAVTFDGRVADVLCSKTRTLRQCKGRERVSNHGIPSHVKGGVSPVGGSTQQGVVGWGPAQRQHVHDSIRLSRLRRARSKNDTADANTRSFVPIPVRARVFFGPPQIWPF